MASPFTVDAVSFFAVIAALIWWKPPPLPSQYASLRASVECHARGSTLYAVKLAD
jgi:hypothetical protein